MFCYTDQSLRYQLTGFEQLTLQQKKLVYYLAKAALYGRDITFDQFGKYNLRIRRVLEVVYTDMRVPRDTDSFRALELYLKRLWFSNGIYHHYGSEKFVPEFDETYFRNVLRVVEARRLPLADGQSVDQLADELCPVMFSPSILAKKVNKKAEDDLVLTSACNFYDGVTQLEAENYYSALKQTRENEPPSYGLNSTLVRVKGQVMEDVWKVGGRYGNAISHIVLRKRRALLRIQHRRR